MIKEVEKNCATGKGITPEDVRAEIITRITQIPVAPTSGISLREREGKTERSDPAFDRLMAEYFTNDTIIIKTINRIGHITSEDPRDFSQVEKKLEEFHQRLQTEVKDREMKEMGEDLYEIIRGELKIRKK